MSRQAGFLHRAKQRGDIFTQRPTRRWAGEGVFRCSLMKQTSLTNHSRSNLCKGSALRWCLQMVGEKIMVNFSFWTLFPGNVCMSLRVWVPHQDSSPSRLRTANTLISSYMRDRSQDNDGLMKDKITARPEMLSYIYNSYFLFKS